MKKGLQQFVKEWNVIFVQNIVFEKIWNNNLNRIKYTHQIKEKPNYGIFTLVEYLDNLDEISGRAIDIKTISEANSLITFKILFKEFDPDL